MKKLERMQNLIVIGHPDKKSFCYNGIFKTIQESLLDSDYLNEIQVIDLYRDDFSRPRTDLIKEYQDAVTWADRIYLNSVKLRLVMGVFTFVFGWNISRWLKTKQFWSVPFVSDAKRKKYLDRVKRDIKKDLKKHQTLPTQYENI